MEQPRLTTARLILRPFRTADAPRVRQLAGAFELADGTLNIPPPDPEGVAAEWIATHPDRFASGEGVSYAIVLQETGELIGAIGLTISKAHSRAEMGYWLGVPYWNQGYMTEAVKAVLDYGFAECGLHKIMARHFPRNPASGRVLQKVGMRFEGVQREHVRKEQQFEDLANYGMLRSEWEEE